jgi:(R,R)-butanediol dehydrogenase/meso-butanediol dehydrogenase/diacetyl reductase
LCTSIEPVFGGFSEYLRAPARAVVPLPEMLSLADGALVEPLAVGLHGVRMAAMRPGARVLVLGAGTVGLATIYWAKRLGAGGIVAASRSSSRADMAIAMGADAFIQTGVDEVAEVKEALGGPPEIVFECAGAVGLLAQAITHVKPFGKVLSLGFCSSPDPITPSVATFKQVQISFPLVTYSQREFQYVADAMLRGHVDPKMMITTVAPLADIAATFERLRTANADTKVHIAPF